MAWDFQWFDLKIRIVLAQIQELRCMQKHINNGGYNGSSCQGWPASFLVCCITYDFALINNLTSSRV